MAKNADIMLTMCKTSEEEKAEEKKPIKNAIAGC